MVITADGLNRGQTNSFKEVVDEALKSCTTIETVIVFNCLNRNITMQAGRDLWWHNTIEGMPKVCPAEEMDSEDMLFYFIYTSGSTGKPKG